MDDSEFNRILAERLQVIEAAGDTDVLLYSGAINREGFNKLTRSACGPDRRPKVLLLLSTYGGDANAGYRIARTLRQLYSHVSIFVAGMCKSAGTLIAVGAHELIVSDFGELGPLDVQIRKNDELFGETASGLNLIQALNTLQERAFAMLENTLIQTKAKSGGQITTKSASELATNLAVGVFSEIYKQIDPILLGEIDRAINIAYDYGDRLPGNLRPDALTSLVAGYPSHGFVIDREEAEKLFVNVRAPNPPESALADHLAHLLLEPADNLTVVKLKSGDLLPHETNEEPTNELEDTADRESAGVEGATVSAVAGEAEPDTAQSVAYASLHRSR